MDSLTIAIAILATWRLSAMLSYETGPFKVFTYMRELVGIVHDDNGEKISMPESFFAELLDCIWCLSVWIGAIIAIGLYLFPVLIWLLLPLSLSAGAIIVERLTRG